MPITQPPLVTARSRPGGLVSRDFPSRELKPCLEWSTSCTSSGGSRDSNSLFVIGSQPRLPAGIPTKPWSTSHQSNPLRRLIRSAALLGQSHLMVSVGGYQELRSALSTCVSSFYTTAT